MVGRNRAGSHGRATVELRTLYFSPVYYSMQRGANTCDKTTKLQRNSELVEAMILALRGCGESWKTSRHGHCQCLDHPMPVVVPTGPTLLVSNQQHPPPNCSHSFDKHFHMAIAK